LMPFSRMTFRMPWRMSSPLPPPRGKPAAARRAYRRPQGSLSWRACGVGREGEGGGGLQACQGGGMGAACAQVVFVAKGVVCCVPGWGRRPGSCPPPSRRRARRSLSAPRTRLYSGTRRPCPRAAASGSSGAARCTGRRDPRGLQGGAGRGKSAQHSVRRRQLRWKAVAATPSPEDAHVLRWEAGGS
jgi:hypothetical protein